MMPAEAIFLEARTKDPGWARDAYLDEACGGDAGLRLAVEGLLAEAARADTYFGASDGLLKPDDVHGASEGVGTVLGRYVLQERIGEGGMGSVYRARQTHPVDREVALKIIKLGMDTRRVVARFQLERQALARMDHPAIARVLDAGCTETGRPYFVMDLVRGRRITEHCDSQRLSIRRRLELFVEVCLAVQHAHQKGIIHRDLKPSNILVAESDEVDRSDLVRVIDFGVAKAVGGIGEAEDRLTSMMGWIGTPAYMSPEQADGLGADVDTRADIYSLGVVLYELLTGRTPFESEALLRDGLEAVVRTLKGKDAAAPSLRVRQLMAEERSRAAADRCLEDGKLEAALRGDLDWIVLKCLEKDRSKRYSTANALARDIQRHLADEPVEAGPVRFRDRLRKAARRNRGMVVLGLGAAALLIGSTAISVSWAIRATVAEGEQARLRGEAEAQTAEAQRSLYVAQMSQAQHLWNMSEFGMLRRLLWEARGSPYRGFEWYYWMRLTHLDDVTYSRHTDSIAAVALSPDDRHVVTGDGAAVVHLWDRVDGRRVQEFRGVSSPVKGLGFGPGGTELFVGGLDGVVHVYDPGTGALRREFMADASGLRAIAMSGDGRRMVTGGGDGRVLLWDTAHTDRPIGGGTLNHPILRVAVTGLGDQFAATCLGGGIRVWKALDAGGEGPLEELEGWGVATAVGFSEDGAHLATGDDHGAVTLWEVATRRRMWTHEGDGNELLALAFSRDGERLFSAGTHPRIQVWGVGDGREVGVLRGHSAWVTSLAVSKEGRRIISASSDATAKVWNVQQEGLSLQEPFRRFEATSDWLQLLEYSPDGRRIMTVVNGAWIWDVTEGRKLLDLQGHAHMIFAADYARAGGRIATAGDDHTLRLWSASDGLELRRAAWPGEVVRSLRFFPDGRRVVFGGDAGVSTVFDVQRWEPVVRTQGPVHPIASVAVAPDGHRFVTAGSDGKGRLWDAATGRMLAEYPVDSVPLVGVEFSPDASRLVFASGTVTGLVSVWDLVGGKVLYRRKIGSQGPNAVRYSPDGRRILVITESSTGELIDSETGDPILSLRGGRDLHRAGAFSPDGREIALGTMTPGRNHEVRLWRAPTDVECDRWLEQDRDNMEGRGPASSRRRVGLR